VHASDKDEEDVMTSFTDNIEVSKQGDVFVVFDSDEWHRSSWASSSSVNPRLSFLSKHGVELLKFRLQSSLRISPMYD